MTVPSEDMRYQRVLYSLDGNHVVCGMAKGEVRILDSSNGAKIKTLKNQDKDKKINVCHMDFSPDGKLLAVAYENRHILIWDVDTCELLHRLVNEEDNSYACHKDKITCLRFTPNGLFLWSVEEKGIHKTWSVKSNYKFMRKGVCPANWYFEDENENMEGEVPGGLFTGQYSLEFPEGNSGDMSLPVMFWDDGRVEGKGNDETGDYTITGTYDLASRTVKFSQETYIATVEYDAQFEYTPDTEKEDGSCHIWGDYSIVTWVKTFKGKFDMTLTGPYPKDSEGNESESLVRAWSGDVSADSRLAVTANDDCTLKFYALEGENDPSTRRRKSAEQMVAWIRFSKGGADPKDVRFHPSNPDVVYGCSAHGSVCGFLVSTKKQFVEYVHGGVIETLAISKHGDRLASLMDGDRLNVMIWDTTSTGKGEESLNGGDTKAMEISALEFSHDGTKLAVIVNNCDYVHVLETESGKIISTIEFYTSYDNICFSPDDSQVFVSHGKDVVVFNVLEGNKVDEFKKVYNYEVGRACFSPQGQLAVLGSDERYKPCKIKVFAYPDKRLIREFDDLDRDMKPGVYFSHDGSKLYALGSTGDTNGAFVAVLCMKTGNVLQEVKPSKDNIYRFCIDVSCTKCIVGSHDGDVYVCDLESGRTLLECKPQSWRINGINSFRIDGQDYVVSGCEDRSFKILDMNTGQQLGHMTSTQGVSAVAAVTITGSNRAYVALGDQGTFVRILQWM